MHITSWFGMRKRYSLDTPQLAVFMRGISYISMSHHLGPSFPLSPFAPHLSKHCIITKLIQKKQYQQEESAE